MNLVQTTIKFNVATQHKKFTKIKSVELIIIHDMPDYGLSIEAALENWTARTKKYTAEDFCRYIMSKNTGCTALTVSQYNRLVTSENKQPQ